MTAKRMVFPGVRGEFPAKIEERPDLEVNDCGVHYDGEFIHVYGAQEESARKFRSLYFLFKNNGATKAPTFYQLIYRSLSEFTLEKAEAREAISVDINFDIEKGLYQASFNGIVKGVGVGPMDILCRFDLVKAGNAKTAPAL